MTNAFRTPPHNVEAEKALLGAILVNAGAYGKVSDFLRPEHFSISEHGRIFEVMGFQVEGGKPTDAVALNRFFENEELLVEIGGTDYLVDLASSVITVGNAKHYGEIVHDLAKKRDLIEAAQELEEAAYKDTDKTYTDLIEGTEKTLYGLTEGLSGGGVREIKDITDNALERAQMAQAAGGILGISTGLPDLDYTIGGLAKSDLIVLGARPGMGKTALGLVVAANVAKAGVPVGFFSLEMSGEQLNYRLLADAASVDQTLISRGRYNEEQWQIVNDAAQGIRALSLHIDDTPGLSITQIRSRARRMKRRHGVGLIVVDHMQLIRAKAENRTQEITKISGDLKVLAKELDIPVVALCQLSRQVEQREDKRPNLSDLRESGSIEQDADIVLFLFREAYYLERAEPKKKPNENHQKFTDRLIDWQADLAECRNLAELIVAKNRHGPTNKIGLYFAPEFSRFGSAAKGMEVAA